MAPIRITMRDNSQDILALMAQNITAALTAMGIKAVSLILWQMRQGFGKPIRYTGDLQRDVSYEIHPDTKSVDVGNSLKYATYVHEGFAGHPVYFESIKEFRILPGGHTAGRPYITKALTSGNGTEAIRTAAENALRQGF